MKLSIILVSYNSIQHLKGCLDSINSISVERIEFEIIIIDNTSTEEVQKIEKLIE